ncbi:hypothetical protein FOL47_003212 [Perkinsus chesapeaki]|uniref:Uncharacterized protein n=1 Tax=Perkinsus chesapeaki TaxID=330153 RepID=A0A7J6M910_PERCH|nr:hypothetical protein FOL47_003212 [Perkinsus chesapeaki]
MSKRPASDINPDKEVDVTDSVDDQQQAKKVKLDDSEEEEVITAAAAEPVMVHGLKKGMKILVKWELVDDEAGPDDPNAVAIVWWPATVDSIKKNGDAVLSYSGHGGEYPAEMANVKVEPDHTLRDSNGVPQDWKAIPDYKPGEEMGGDVTCPKGHSSRLLTWGARREAQRKASNKSEQDDIPLICDVCLTISSNPDEVLTHCTDCGDWEACRYCIAAWRRTGEWPFDDDVKEQEAYDTPMAISDLMEIVGNEMTPEAVQSAANEEFGELPVFQQQILATGFRTFIETFKAELNKFRASRTVEVITEDDMKIILSRCREYLKSALTGSGVDN